VLSVITGLIPRHVCAPYLLCGDPRCLSTSEDKAKLLHASDEPRIDRDEENKPIRVWLSAQSGVGIPQLFQALTERLSGEVAQ
ncbi:hypothetical protein KU735_24045, partial [Salmonella enterica subsp. enterica serovar Give]|nr:hypothetical protein [Salmonella enterica subsp. enterica serovar Give]